MIYSLKIYTGDEGDLVAKVYHGQIGRAVPYQSDLLMRYEIELRAIRERNPDMTPAQASDFVLKRWFLE